MEICDRVAGDQNGPKESVQSLIKRLAHRNANVQLYTLEVSLLSSTIAVALGQGMIDTHTRLPTP
jgi:hypothetical protein